MKHSTANYSLTGQCICEDSSAKDVKIKDIQVKKRLRMPATALAAVIFIFTACNNQPAKQQAAAEPTAFKEEAVTYGTDSLPQQGYIAYNDSNYKRPGILVVPEWWGVTDYVRGRARQLAELGYVALVVDMYGNGQTADDPKEAGKLAGAFYNDPQLTRSRFDAALAKLKSYPQVDTDNIAAIGYCFGGAVVLNVAKMGEDLKGVVSFHGSLQGVPADKSLLKAKILVCHGDSDQMVNAQVPAFKKQMDSIGADYKFIGYPNALHAFTNPEATEKGKKFSLPIAYNAQADSASWADMKQFFGTIFQQAEPAH